MRRQDIRHSKPRRFHMEEMWIKFPECEDIISSSWSEVGRASVTGTVQKKINTCVANLSKWSHHKFGGNRGRIDHLNRELETHIHGRVILDKVTVQNIKAELNELLEGEETYWRQCLRVTWMRDGDRNLKFFHMKASQRQSRNVIRGLRDSNGVCWEDP